MAEQRFKSGEAVTVKPLNWTGNVTRDFGDGSVNVLASGTSRPGVFTLPAEWLSRAPQPPTVSDLVRLFSDRSWRAKVWASAPSTWIGQQVESKAAYREAILRRLEAEGFDVSALREESEK
jgi:hypothetical protein